MQVLLHSSSIPEKLIRIGALNPQIIQPIHKFSPRKPYSSRRVDFTAMRSTSGKFHTILNAFCSLILLLFLYNHKDHTVNPNSSTSITRRKISELPINSNLTIDEDTTPFCSNISTHKGFHSECGFLRAHVHCSSDGFIDYINFFYCTCSKVRFLGYSVLCLWVVLLFYLLGNTAADYFCPSLSKLSTLLKLPPTIAGITLLPLGNGAPDVFASIAAFMGNGNGDVGINSVLGGALFVTSVVVGLICIAVDDRNVQIDRKCFIRDTCVFLFTLMVLSMILMFGEIGFWGAILFVSIYVIYAFIVAANELWRKHPRRLRFDAVNPLLPLSGTVFDNAREEDESIYSSLISDLGGGDVPMLDSLPAWMWASKMAIYSNRSDSILNLWGSHQEEGCEENKKVSFMKLLLILETPLTLPRKLSIPIVEEDRWSKVYAVASALLSPVLLSFLWNSGKHEISKAGMIVYFFGVVLGIILGCLAFSFTKNDRPPGRFMLPWVLGGFIMSITWFYIIANELVSLLVALGVIFRINPSILGLTVMAWGNSMGDLMSNVALALNGGDGAQIAMSGCYAGPMFNTLAGLGISMLLVALSAAPKSYVLPQDRSLIYTMGFLMLGLVLALFILPRNDMRPNKVLGIGLISLYIVFIFIRISSAMGFISLSGL